jgi:hypothetical protein
MTLEPDQLSREEWERLQLDKLRKTAAYLALYNDEKPVRTWDKPMGRALRWGLVGPVAVMTVLASSAVWEWIVQFLFGYSNPTMILSHQQIFAMAFIYLWVSGMVLMGVIAAIAPAHKSGITLFLATYAVMYLLKIREVPESLSQGWFEMATWLCIAVSMLKLWSLPER